MLTTSRFTSLLTLLFIATWASAQDWKAMKDDPRFNVYDVIAVAEAHFDTIDITVKGSGWKGYQRWKHDVEPQFYPSGDRSQADPYFAARAFERFMAENPGETRSAADDAWFELGPYFIEEVTGHYSCGLGRVESFYVDTSGSDRIYLGSRSGGFWKSEDGGATWTGGSTDFLVACGVNSIAVPPQEPDEVLINLRNSRNGVTHGLYRSIDAGETWDRTEFNPDILGWGGLGTVDRITEVAYHPVVEDLLFIASSRGLYRSDDDLQTWTNPVASGNFTRVAFHPTDTSVIYAVNGDDRSRIYVSHDGGNTFQTSGTIPGNDASVRMSVSAACSTCVFVASSDGVWRSVDEGVTFELISSPGIDNYGGFAVSDVSVNYMLTGDIDTWMSIDGGQSFDRATYWADGNANYDQTGTYVHADIRGARSFDGVFWINTDGFLCKSEDNGATWEFYEGQSIRENYNLGVSQSNHYRTICGSQDNGTSIATENGWVEFFGADGMEGIIHPLNHDWMMGSFQYGGRRVTRDGGLTQQGATPHGPDGAWIAPLVYDPNDQMVLYDFRESVYRSRDFGTTWMELGSPSFDNSISYATIAENDSRIMVATRGANIELSRNGGISFSSIRANLPNKSITDVAFDPNDDDVIVVVNATHQNDGQKVFITFNQGFTWNNITHNLGDLPIRSVVIDHTEASTIYVGTELGIYKKAMDADNWELYSPGLPSVSVPELEVVYGSNTLRAATWGRGLWEFDLDGRGSYPSIMSTQTTDLPTENKPQAGIDQHVTSVISYGDTMTSVYVAWSVDTQSFANTIEMVNVHDSTWMTASPLPAQEEETRMFFKVFAVGSAGDTTETYKFMYETRPFQHCISFGNMAYATAVTRVQLNDIDNASGKTQPYTDYSESIATNVSYGTPYDLSVNLNTDGNYTIFARAWIDWNRDADFDDPGEEIELGSSTNTVDGPTTLSPVDIAVPIDARLGETVMRVSCRYSFAPTNCETSFDGEVEDYAIIVNHVTLSEEINASICSGDSIYLAGAWRNSPGTYVDTVLMSEVVDSVIITHLEVTDSYQIAFEIIGCDSVVFDDDKTYYESADTMVLFEGNGGACDTVVTVHINVLHAVESEIWETACESYEAPSGDTTYTESGTYVDVIQSTQGCDSIITIHLEIEEVDTSVFVEPPMLTAGIADAAAYQWIDCEAMAPIEGATGQVFTASESGVYAVEITTQAGCVDTSACIDVTVSSVVESTFDQEIRCFPNPTEGQVTIDLGAHYTALEVTVRTMDGRMVSSDRPQSGHHVVLDIPGPAGIYLLELRDSSGQHAILRVVKQ